MNIIGWLQKYRKVSYILNVNQLPEIALDALGIDGP